MNPETFRAESVTAALEEVQRKLGPDALVVSVRQAPASPWQVWKTPMVEVLAMPPAAPQASLPPAPAPKTAGNPLAAQLRAALAQLPAQPAAAEKHAAAEKPAQALSLAEKLAAIEKLVAAQKQNAAERPAAEKSAGEKPAPAASTADAPASPAIKANPTVSAAADPAALPGLPASLSQPLARVRERLLAQGVDVAPVQQMIARFIATQEASAGWNEARLRTFFEVSLRALLTVCKTPPLLAGRVIFLVGGSGAGKSGLCAKLAAYNRSHHNRKTAWICADTLKSGALSEAQFYTSALDIPLYIAYTPEELALQVQENRDADLILVDTHRFNPYLESSLVALGSFLTAVPQRSTFLVASAGSKEADLHQALSALQPLNLTGLICSHLDETNTFGSLYNLACRSHLPLAFYSHGTRVLDDLTPADAALLVKAILGEKAFI